jgi:hypothetical protein
MKFPTFASVISSAVLLMMTVPAPAKAQIRVNTWSGGNFSNYVEGNGFSSITFTGGVEFRTPNFRGGSHFQGNSSVIYHGSSGGTINMYSGGESSSW